MSRMIRMMRVSTAIATVLLAVLLCWQCIDIYTDGVNQIEAAQQATVSIYSYQEVSLRLKQLVLPAILYVLLVAFTATLHVFPCERNSGTYSHKVRIHHSDACAPVKHVHITRTLLLILACLFIVLGVMNGGMYDVLVKAINICTECIGLG